MKIILNGDQSVLQENCISVLLLHIFTFNSILLEVSSICYIYYQFLSDNCFYTTYFSHFVLYMCNLVQLFTSSPLLPPCRSAEAAATRKAFPINPTQLLATFNRTQCSYDTQTPQKAQTETDTRSRDVQCQSFSLAELLQRLKPVWALFNKTFMLLKSPTVFGMQVKSRGCRL